MADDADDHEKDVEELDERMQKLTHKLENARRDMDFDKAQRVLDKIDAHQHEQELKVQEKLKASERKLEKAKKAGNAEDEEKYKGKIAKFEEKLKAMHVGAGNWQEVDAKGHVRFVPLSAQINVAAPFMTSTPSTRRLLDGVSHSQVQLPKETFRFVESVCYNAKFDKDNVYVPVQHNDLDCYVYKFSLTAGEGDITPELIGHVLLKNGEDDITPFGSALSPDGVMWICMFNVNMVVGYDLKTKEVVGQVQCPAPNDVCLSEDGTKLWAGCGSRMGKVVIGGGAGTIHMATDPDGRMKGKATEVLDRGQGTMAGIAEKGGIVYCAHLQRMSAYDCGEDTAWRFWKGNDPEDGQYYLCDNLAWWGKDTLLTPCYRVLDGTCARLMDEHADLGAAAWAGGAAVTFMKTLATQGVSTVKAQHENGFNPECDLELSKGDKFPHVTSVHVSTYSLKTRKTTNYRINCDAYDEFDGHCTHAEPAGGKIILVNFMYHKIMVVDMEAFPGAPSENEE